MEDEENTAYFYLENLAFDLKFKSINKDEIKQGNNIYALLHLIDKQQKELEQVKEITIAELEKKYGCKVKIINQQYDTAKETNCMSD